MNGKIIIATLGLFALPAFAMPGGGYGGNLDEQIQQCRKPFETLQEQLSLRPDQVDTVQQIMEEQHEKRHSIGRKSREQHRALHEETVEKLGTVLDAEQLARFESFTSGMKMARQCRKAGSRHRIERTTDWE